MEQVIALIILALLAYGLLAVISPTGKAKDAAIIGGVAVGGGCAILILGLLVLCGFLWLLMAALGGFNH